MAGCGARAAAVLSAAVLLAACGERGRHGAAPVAPPVVQGVEIVTLRPEAGESMAEAVGTVRARTAAAVAPQMMGRLTAVAVSEGSTVSAGAILATIDDRAARAQLSSAEGAVAEAESAREEAILAVAQAEAGSDLAEKTHARFAALLAEKVVTQQEYDEVAARRAVATSERERMLARRAQAEGRIAQAKGAAEAARTALAWTKVTAPFSGVVVEKTAEPGSMAVPGVPLFVVEDPGRHRIEASASETYLPLLKAGSRVQVVLDVSPGEPFPAVVTEVVPAVDPGSRTYTVKVDLPPGKARSGQSGKVRFSAGKGTVLAVPKRAITRAGGSDGVFRVGSDNVARLSPVTLGAEFGDRVEVLSGLSAGSRVAVAPLDRIFDGAVVEIRN
jgi:RND family efflux transporter MFP subunit